MADAIAVGAVTSVGRRSHLDCLPGCEFRRAQSVAGQYALMQPSELFYDQRLHVVTVGRGHFCQDDLPNNG
ncbi:hypothetical protein CBM2633_B10601 [Cupriavidus taiwanensis]|uniref:Uncharacterized protein n=1 Tax=Cupriavidus taiwanensis TaxID=164546 RepID=A0A375EAS2_9BURK|nr:hypothetical protein CBM2615_B190285 [Cupriavidus taiwanensis]SOZ70812.1 hypothetical protein CBM2613_B170251 [Cupriavidus taiwanensis]SPA08963.1 hypothetical protein CBM2625_B170285 [Cupriavidus taiwanensis]SPA18371.1 hypothetical protein CBM2633_B10601 [Cupriavidus taiwanensis]